MENIFTDEKTWAMLCGCFGSCYAIYYVISGQNHYGFMKYTHYCPSCNEIISVYQPESSTKLKIILVTFICVIISLKIIVFVALITDYSLFLMIKGGELSQSMSYQVYSNHPSFHSVQKSLF